jgi:cobalamin-dependent methionine synthase I
VICRFVVTLGKELDEQIRQTQEASMFSAYLLDAVGSVLAECLADQMESSLAGILRGEGLQATGRFSPGYCDWEIRDGQAAIFGGLQPETIGVTCTSSGMMFPRKSISACMLGAAEVVQRYPCGFCSRGGCEYRRPAALEEGARSSA